MRRCRSIIAAALTAAVLTLSACGSDGPGADDAALCEAARQLAASSQALVDSLLAGDDEAARVDVVRQSVTHFEAVAAAIDSPDQAAVFTELADGNRQLVEAFDAQPGSLPEPRETPVGLADRARQILIDRCGVDYFPEVPATGGVTPGGG